MERTSTPPTPPSHHNPLVTQTNILSLKNYRIDQSLLVKSPACVTPRLQHPQNTVEMIKIHTPVVYDSVDCATPPWIQYPDTVEAVDDFRGDQYSSGSLDGFDSSFSDGYVFSGDIPGADAPDGIPDEPLDLSQKSPFTEHSIDIKGGSSSEKVLHFEVNEIHYPERTPPQEHLYSRHIQNDSLNYPPDISSNLNVHLVENKVSPNLPHKAESRK